MAKIEMKFLDAVSAIDCSVKCNFIKKSNYVDDEYIKIELLEGERINTIFLDKSTAIKFAKTLRTEINKIQV